MKASFPIFTDIMVIFRTESGENGVKRWCFLKTDGITEFCVVNLPYLDTKYQFHWYIFHASSMNLA